MADSINDINISQQNYYQLILLSPSKQLVDVTPQQIIEESPSQPSENHLTLSAQARQAALTYSPLELEDAQYQQSIDVADEDSDQTFKNMFANSSRTYHALQAYAQVTEFDKTAKHIVSIFI